MVIRPWPEGITLTHLLLKAMQGTWDPTDRMRPGAPRRAIKAATDVALLVLREVERAGLLDLEGGDELEPALEAVGAWLEGRIRPDELEAYHQRAYQIYHQKLWSRFWRADDPARKASLLAAQVTSLVTQVAANLAAGHASPFDSDLAYAAQDILRALGEPEDAAQGRLLAVARAALEAH